MSSKELNWYKLDNSAKIYPILTGDRYTYVFRVSATLKETVNKELLYQVILEAKKRFPSFYVKLKRGFFWYYFEENIHDPILIEETSYSCEKIDELYNKRYLFRFMYYQNRITLEINHVLTDGGGAVVFLNAVIYRYLELMGKNLSSDKLITLMDSKIDYKELEDGYASNYSGQKLNPPKIPKAYFKKRKIFTKLGSGIINSFIDSDELVALAKVANASLTQYIVALLTYSTIKTGNKKLLKKYPVNICVPVNLRKAYHSKTLNNFSLYFHTSYQARELLEFEDILEKVKLDFKEEYTQEKIQAKLDTICVIQGKIFIKLIPLFIKYILFKIGYNTFGKKPTSLTVSNFGVIKIPKSMEEHVDSFSFYLGSALKHAVAMNSYKGKTSIVFSRAMINTELEETFFKFLTDKGIHIEIVSNYWELSEKKYKTYRKKK